MNSFQKFPTLFVRDFQGLMGPPGKFVTNVVNEDAIWVIDGHGYATRKWDGTCCCISKDPKIFINGFHKNRVSIPYKTWEYFP